jgi:hypothetical protein
VFWRGNDVFDPVKVGFVSDQAEGRQPSSASTPPSPATATAATRAAYGTELPEADKAALVEFLKTF